MSSRAACLLTSVLLVIAASRLPVTGQSTVLAISGATVIDGTGGAPIADAVVLISSGSISALGSRASVKIPAEATVIDARGKYLVPGLDRHERASVPLRRHGRPLRDTGEVSPAAA